MRIVEPSYEILTTISKGGIEELKTIERAARVCYRSENYISEDGESAKRLVRMLVNKQHGAMLEHGPNLQVVFTVDRAIANELVRHRLASFAQESTRYCNYTSGKKFDGGICFIRPFYIPMGSIAETVWINSCKQAEEAYKTLSVSGYTPEEARCVLPLCTATKIVITANYREWRHIFHLRTDNAAHPQMREIMCKLYEDLKTRIPVIFDEV